MNLIVSDNVNLIVWFLWIPKGFLELYWKQQTWTTRLMANQLLATCNLQALANKAMLQTFLLKPKNWLNRLNALIWVLFKKTFQSFSIVQFNRSIVRNSEDFSLLIRSFQKNIFVDQESGSKILQRSYRDLLRRFFYKALRSRSYGSSAAESAAKILCKSSGKISFKFFFFLGRS